MVIGCSILKLFCFEVTALKILLSYFSFSLIQLFFAGSLERLEGNGLFFIVCDDPKLRIPDWDSKCRRHWPERGLLPRQNFVI